MGKAWSHISESPGHHGDLGFVRRQGLELLHVTDSAVVTGSCVVIVLA
jgi:hypothetical protein